MDECNFRLEEELLFPPYAGYGDPHDPVILRALGQRALIRHRANAVAAATSADRRTLGPLGTELVAPVRLEEREVLPLIERLMPQRELDALGDALEAADPER